MRYTLVNHGRGIFTGTEQACRRKAAQLGVVIKAGPADKVVGVEFVIPTSGDYDYDSMEVHAVTASGKELDRKMWQGFDESGDDAADEARSKRDQQAALTYARQLCSKYGVKITETDF